MGAGLCCARQDGALVVVNDSTFEASRHGNDLPRTKKDDENIQSSVGFCYTDEEGTDIFFSAQQSFTQIVNGLPYPPTSSRKSGRSSKITVDVPESLLLLQQDDAGAIGKIDEEVEKLDASSSRSSNSSIRRQYSRRPTKILTERLTEREQSEAGYPGELSQDELEACLEFRRRLKEHPDPTYRIMVHLNVDVDVDVDSGMDGSGSGSDINDTTLDVSGKGPEEEAFALCRFLRARQFDVDKTFAMMDEHVELFKEVYQKHDLYRSKATIEDQNSCPLPVLWKQFPIINHGLAKNGAFVVYMKAGMIRLEHGFDCINKAPTPKAFVERYMPMAWYCTCRVFCETIHRNQKQLHQEQQEQPQTDSDDFVVLAEVVVIIDLEDLQRELVTKRTLEIVQHVFGVIKCFPEILNRVIVVNVPYFFTLVWAGLKMFVDARTTRKIGFFPTLASAQKELFELVDKSQLLVEYGGQKSNPTYNQALEVQLRRDGEYDRYVFETYSSKTQKMPSGTNSMKLQTFALTENESAELTVYTQANLGTTADGKSTTSGTKFLLLPEQTNGEATKAGTNTRRSSRFGQPAALVHEHSKVHGPGNFQLMVQKTPKEGPAIDMALLVVSIR